MPSSTHACHVETFAQASQGFGRGATGMTFDDYVKFTVSPENLRREGFDIRRFSLVRPHLDWSRFLRERHAKARLTDDTTKCSKLRPRPPPTAEVGLADGLGNVHLSRPSGQAVASRARRTTRLTLSSVKGFSS